VSPSADPLAAAGAVLWRPSRGVEVALVHRPRYDDWSLPKGKVEHGEHRVVAAVRELAEETGHHGQLGRYLGRSEYRVPAGRKRVDYWAARCRDGWFTPNNEVDQLRWTPVEQAARMVTHPGDARVLATFAALPADTATLLVVRHARAGHRKDFPGPDTQRPLEGAGRTQAAALVAVCRAFGPTTVHAADRVRCTQTVQPLADDLGVAVQVEPTLSEEAYAADPAAGVRRAQQVMDAAGTPVLCSQGGVIPDLVARWAQAGGIAVPDLRTRKASTWVLSSVAGRVVALHHLPDPFH